MSTETKSLIVETASKMFCKYGIKSVTVDEICYALPISKKTFYEFFENKNELVEQIANNFLWEIEECIDDLLLKQDVIDKIILFYSFLLEKFKSCNTAFLYDLKKYHPNIFNLFDQYKDNVLKNLFVTLYNEGKQEGLFTNDFEPEIVFSIHWKRFNNIIERKLLEQKNLYDPIFVKLMKISLIGISTLKGHKIIEEKFNKLN